MKFITCTRCAFRSANDEYSHNPPTQRKVGFKVRINAANDEYSHNPPTHRKVGFKVRINDRIRPCENVGGKVRAVVRIQGFMAPKLVTSDGVRYAFDDCEACHARIATSTVQLGNGVPLTVAACTSLDDATQSDATHVVNRSTVTHPNDMYINKDLSFTPAIDKKATRVSSVNCLMEKMWHHALLSPYCGTPGHLDAARVSDNVCCNVNRVRKLRWDPLLKYVSRIDDVGLNKSNSLVLKIQQQLADGHYVAATSSCSDLE
ncbi:hypothetical protein Tco_0662928 [Tanacetum coccineum]